MTILIGALEFIGPLQDLSSLCDQPGIYAVLCESNGEFELVEMSDADRVREQLICHPEREFWNSEGLKLSFAVHYTLDLTEQERYEIKEALDREFSEHIVEPIAA